MIKKFDQFQKLNESFNIYKISNSNNILDKIYSIIGEENRNDTYGNLRYFLDFGKKDEIIPFLKTKIDLTEEQIDNIKNYIK